MPINWLHISRPRNVDITTAQISVAFKIIGHLAGEVDSVSLSVWKPSNMTAKLSELIHAFAAPQGARVNGVQFAHGVSRTVMTVPMAKVPDFLDQYCALAVADEAADVDAATSPTRGFLIGEVIGDRPTVPLSMGMLLRFHLTPEQRKDPELFERGFVLSVVNILQELMMQKLVISKECSEYLCCVLESQPWTKGEDTFVQLRFHHPYAQIENGYQNRVLKPAVAKMLRERNLLARGLLKVEPCDRWEDIIQDFVDVLPLYRGKDAPDQSPLTLQYVYSFVTAEDIDNDDKDEIDLKTVCLPAQYSLIYTNTIDRTFIEKNVDIKYWLPLLLSVRYWSGVAQIKAVETSTPSPYAPIEPDGSVDEGKNPLGIVKTLLPMLKQHRIDVEPFWLDVGRVLFNLTNGGLEGLNIWIQFSSKATVAGRDDKTCTVQYYQLRPKPNEGPLTHRTIGWYAREDSRDEYVRWHNAWCEPALYDALSMIETDVAEALYRVFWIDYICAGLSRNVWYQFTGTYLKPLDDAHSLRRDITERLIPIYKQIRVNESQRSAKADKDADHQFSETRIKQINNLIKKLGSRGFRNAIVGLAKEWFYVEKFDTIRDADPNRMAWLNCVIECCGDQAYVRAGKPEDFITMNTGMPFQHDLDWKHPLVVELMTWFGQIFTDKALLHYFLKDLASFLYGKNAEKLFRVWSGPTNAGKSMLVKLFQFMLGDYGCDFPVDMLCEKTMKNESGLNPALAAARGTHGGFVAEPGQNDVLSNGKLKRWTGGDRIYARMCNSNDGKFDAFFKLVLMCNGIPQNPDADEAGMGRYLILPFVSTWSLKAPESIEEQYKQRLFKMDPFFERRLPDLARACSWIAVQYYSIYKKEGLIPPQIVKDYTQKHWDENDLFLNFVGDCVEMATLPPDAQGRPQVDVSQTLTATDLYQRFKTWYNDEFPKTPIPAKPRFTAKMVEKSRLGPQDKRRWKGVRVKAKELGCSK